jgi:hypothetical protein
MTAELHVELLLGRVVRAGNGHAIGRIEAIHAEPDGDDFAVTEFHLGRYAFLERLAVSPIGGALLDTFRLRKRSAGYRVRWNQTEFSDPDRPKLTVSVPELTPLD